MKLPSKQFLVLMSIVAMVVVASGGGLFLYDQKFQKLPLNAAISYQTPEESDVYVRFSMEAYDKIKDNYWNKVKDESLSDLFRLALAKTASVSADTITLPSKDRVGTAKMLAKSIAESKNDTTKKELTLNTLMVVLYNLAPAGRDGILSSKQETALRENVSNIDTSKNLYQDLGLAKGADKVAVEKAYEEKKAVLEKDKSPEAVTNLKAVTYAHEVLTQDDTKSRYDEKQIEPTVFSRAIGGTFYVDISKISPTTLEELGKALATTVSNPKLDSMVIDLRGNVGGALEFAQYFLGLFLGQNQYAFDFYHQGDFQVQRTMMPKLEELKIFKDIAVLTDNMTQSTAELMTASVKHFNLAHVVGTKTRGWGTIENTFPMETVIDPSEKYSLLLVHSITLRDDGQSIEGLGVDPDIDITKSDWKTKLPQFFRSPNIIKVLSDIATKPPMR